ncbi:hypothetical protein [Rhodococcus pyridinivorans]
MDILGYLARPNGLPLLSPDRRISEEYQQPAVSPLGFVEPNVIVDGDVPDIPDVILISAPAAVGKSWLARYLSAETGNPLVDLGAFSVGSMHYSGLFAEVYGPEGIGRFVEMLRAGDATLIVDSADEALVRVGSAAFEDSLVDLVKLIRSSVKRQAAGVVILGRGDTIQDCAAQLELEGVRVLNARVDFFNESTARKFVKAKIRTSGGRPIAELDDFLSEFFSYVSQALDVKDFDGARDFLGYAPVLDTLAEFYQSSPNPMKLLQSLEVTEDSRHIWVLLSRVIRAVCRRETMKFGNNFGGDSQDKVEFARKVYTPEFQFRLLLSDGHSRKPEPDIPDDADPTWLDDLMERIEQQFKEHPFRVERYGDPSRRGVINPLIRFTSPAFRDYVLAWGLANLDGREVQTLVHYAESPQLNPTPMLSRFIFLDDVYTNDKVLSPAILATIADSLASVDETAGVRLWIAQSSAQEPLILRLAGGQGLVSDVELALDGTQELTLGRRAAHLVADVPDFRIVAGSGQAEFVLGPQSDITCATFSSEAAEVRVRSGEGAEPSTLVVDQLMGSTQRVVAPHAPALRIITDEIRFPWQRFHWEPNLGEESWRDLYFAGTLLKRLVTWFTRPSMGKGGLQFPCVAMDTILSKGRAPSDVFDFCKAQGYLTVRKPGPVYSLEFPFAVPVILSIYFEDENYVNFLREFIEWRRTVWSPERIQS